MYDDISIAIENKDKMSYFNDLASAFLQ